MVLKKLFSSSSNQINTVSSSNQNQVTSGPVTIVKVGGVQQNPPVQPGGYTRRAKLGDSRSTGRLHTAQNTNTHRSMTKLNIPGIPEPLHLYIFIFLYYLSSF